MDRARLSEVLGSLDISPELAGELRSLLASTFVADELDFVPTRPPGPERSLLPERYEDRGRLGIGGMGEVRRVHDRILGREVALKMIRADVALGARAVERFVAEARATAALSHPGIVAVYDHGFLPDGRPYFTMQEVRGQSFADLIRQLHVEDDPRSGFRRLMDSLERAAAAVGYAHARGVVHRDLKPANLLVGEHGEVRVVDWGLFRPDPTRDAPPALLAAVAGTPAYMAPEQARGELAQIDARTDVYALGCVLWTVISGHPPFSGVDMVTILERLVAGHGPGTAEAVFPIADELTELVDRCLSPLPADRPASADAVAVALRRWLDGETRRDRARAALDQARALADGIGPLWLRATAARRRAVDLAAATRPWEPDTTREAGWAADDEATALELACRRSEHAIDAALDAALTHDPEDVDAHAAVADRAREAHARAERTGDLDAAAVAELRLLRHAEALPHSHGVRVRATRWLQGDGALTLHTDPPGARVVLHRYAEVRRRLVPVGARELGPTPLDRVPIGRGRWLLTIHAEGRPVVRLPVQIDREEYWHGAPPGETDARPVPLPETRDLGPDDCYVPAGWCRIGGDAEAPSGLAARRVWVDGFVMRRFVVTNTEYLAFVNDLLASDPVAAERFAPRDRGRTAGTWGEVLYGRDPDGRFVLRTDTDGDTWQPDWPVVMIDHAAAWAFARWEAARTRQPWRLPGELEWEKAARAGDGRIFPWGDRFDPSWSANRLAYEGAPRMEAVTERPLDESACGVRGLAGLVVEWTADRMRLDGPTSDGARVVVPDGTDDAESAWGERTATHRIVGRGGSRGHDEKAARSAFRLGLDPWARASNVGL